MVKSETRRDTEILVRNPSPRLFGEKFWDSKKVKTNHAKTRLRDWSKILPRFRDPAKIFRDPRFSKYHSPLLLVSAILGIAVFLEIAWLVLNNCYRNFREFGEGIEGINFFRKHSTGMNLPFEYQVFHTNGKCSKVSGQWKQCDGKARSETRKISVRGEEWYYHVLFKIRSFSHFYWTFAKSFVSHFRFW